MAWRETLPYTKGNQITIQPKRWENKIFVNCTFVKGLIYRPSKIKIKQEMKKVRYANWKDANDMNRQFSERMRTQSWVARELGEDPSGAGKGENIIKYKQAIAVKRC